MLLAFVFVLIGFGTKTGLFPMHAWLPDAHSEAPSPVSALLSAVLLNCALLVMIRYYIIICQAIGSDFPNRLLLIFGMLSVAVAAFFILVQRDIKRLLAYSSVENMGLVAVALGIGGPLGIFAALLHTLNHSLAKTLLVSAVPAMYCSSTARAISTSSAGCSKSCHLPPCCLAAVRWRWPGCRPSTFFLANL